MSTRSFTPVVLSGLLFCAALLADDPAQPVDPLKSAEPAVQATPPLRGIRLHLMEGSVMSGKLSIESVSVETRFGTLQIPVESLVSFTPGLDSHPDERKRITRLIQQLGSNAAAERDAAHRQLADLGVQVQNELARHVNDEDAERRTRVQKLLAELEEADRDEDEDPIAGQPWIGLDTVETDLFTVVGRIAPQTFQVQTQFGMLNVAVSDIRRGERDTEQKPEIRKSLSVNGSHLVQLTMLSSNVRVSRGDRVNVTADGKLVMSPWGNNVTSSPDGSEQFQWFVPNQIPGGALVARIGNGGKIFRVGSKASFTASRTGTLYFGIAMNPQFATTDYNYPGEYNVKIRVNQK